MIHTLSLKQLWWNYHSVPFSIVCLHKFHIQSIWLETMFCLSFSFTLNKISKNSLVCHEILILLSSNWLRHLFFKIRIVFLNSLCLVKMYHNKITLTYFVSSIFIYYSIYIIIYISLRIFIYYYYSLIYLYNTLSLIAEVGCAQIQLHFHNCESISLNMQLLFSCFSSKLHVIAKGN